MDTKKKTSKIPDSILVKKIQIYKDTKKFTLILLNF